VWLSVLGSILLLGCITKRGKILRKRKKKKNGVKTFSVLDFQRIL
jgi:hypothetical protein